MQAHAAAGRRYAALRVLLAARGCAWWLLSGALAAPSVSCADALTDVQLLRVSGCGGLAPALGPLRHLERLDRAAEHWASGHTLAAAAEHAGDSAQKLAGVHVMGIDDAILQSLRKTGCRPFMSRELADTGIYRRGQDAWLVFATADVAPPAIPSPGFAARVLELVNEVRRRGTVCGGRSFGPATLIHSSTALEQVAYGHAVDMAQHAYFEHRDLAGRTPADRVRAAGYREKLVGENIAYGPKSPEEVVRGWLASPDHCENIMDPRFAEMGIGYAPGQAPGRASGLGLYWVQLLADPKT
jgi:uncharacterized protein YkwD